MGFPQDFAEAGNRAFEALRRGILNLRNREPAPLAAAATGDDGPAPALPAAEGEEGFDEFAEMLSDLGSDGAPSAVMDGGEARLDLAEQTIEELRANLLQLQPLGEQLAEVEQARLDLLAELEELREAPESEVETLRAELDAAKRELAKRDGRLATMQERLDRMRVRYEERHRTAARRWHEIVELRREIKLLRD